MGDDGIITKERSPKLIAEHRIVLLVAMAGVIGLIFAAFGLVLYHASGSAQLDLSRPGYASITAADDSIERDLREYPASGPIDAKALEDFEELYLTQLDEARQVDAFGGDPMALDSLGIDDNTKGQ